MCCQVQDAGRLSGTGTEPHNSTTLHSPPLPPPANSAEPVTAASTNGQRGANINLQNEPGTNATLMTPATPNSNGSVSSAAPAKASFKPEVTQQSAAPPAKAPIKPEVTQQAAAPATGSAALLARIRSAPHHSSCSCATPTDLRCSIYMQYALVHAACSGACSMLWAVRS